MAALGIPTLGTTAHRALTKLSLNFSLQSEWASMDAQCHAYLLFLFGPSENIISIFTPHTQ